LRKYVGKEIRKTFRKGGDGDEEKESGEADQAGLGRMGVQ
jgi:hypothetical protein